MDLDLSGRHALVCGASSGIGRAAAVALAGLKCNVTVLARRASELNAVRPILARAGAQETHLLVADLEKRDDLKRQVEAHLEKTGPIHILINNTGGPKSGPLLDAKEEDFLAPYGRHLLASHLLTQLCVPGMKEAGYGRIVNVLSWSVREPIPNLGVSNTIRATMASWAKTLSKELPPGITINSVLPGTIDTERLAELTTQIGLRTGKGTKAANQAWIDGTPEGRLGTAQEMANVIAFLCSPAASFVRGIVMPVDGGRLFSI